VAYIIIKAVLTMAYCFYVLNKFLNTTNDQELWKNVNNNKYLIRSEYYTLQMFLFLPKSLEEAPILFMRFLF
jgi:hypothetical protein